MAFLIPGFLPEDTLERVHQLIPLLAWRDGKETAGRLAKDQKNNSQADLSTRDGAKLRDLLTRAITNNTMLQRIAWPKAFSKIIVSRAQDGGGYDWHTDDALMTVRDGKLRSDLSFTLFLSPPDSYAGGALEIHAHSGVNSYKPDSGDILIYPTKDLHRVATVTRGSRIACVGWIESQIRDASHRETLFDLVNLRETLQQTYAASSPEILTLSKTISNLIRAWS
ncbi:MAG: Fe2+-dependent dioxygenase [Pseudomonadota bacterium]